MTLSRADASRTLTELLGLRTPPLGIHYKGESAEPALPNDALLGQRARWS